MFKNKASIWVLNFRLRRRLTEETGLKPKANCPSLNVGLLKKWKASNFHFKGKNKYYEKIYITEQILWKIFSTSLRKSGQFKLIKLIILLLDLTKSKVEISVGLKIFKIITMQNLHFFPISV